ncbi:MAG: hypothetical protein HY231_21400 [Acidobacteria bacterium]|nr:hypothetical protein [Acidobacteriota bacterium]
MSETQRLQKTSFFPVVIFFICGALFSLGIWTSKAKSKQPQNDIPKVKNETESFYLENIERREKRLILKMKNISGKGITAYSFSTNENEKQDFDYSISGHVIKPGEIEEIEISLDNLSPRDGVANKNSTIRILAIVFEDHSSEGDFNIANEIRDHRLGEKNYIQRINQYIEEVLTSPKLDPSTALKMLKSHIALVSEDTYPKFSFAYRMGLRSAKRNILYLLENLEQQEKKGKFQTQTLNNTGSSFRQEINKIKSQMEGWLSRY